MSEHRIEQFDGGQTVNTTLTPNSNCRATASGDPTDDTQLLFMYADRIPYWSPIVNSSTKEITNDRDRGNDVVTFTKGLRVTYTPLFNGYYTVLVDGEIVDSGSTYKITGKSLGTFSAAKQAR